MFYGRLLDKNAHRCESLADLSYPVVLLKDRKSGRDRFIESLRSDFYGVLNVSDILDRNCARSKNHVQSVAYSPFVRHAIISRSPPCVGDASEIKNLGHPPRRHSFPVDFSHSILIRSTRHRMTL
jgi:hypothetical protein